MEEDEKSLVERLRGIIDACQADEQSFVQISIEFATEAADALEQLQGELEQKSELANEQAATITALRAENEHLNMELDKIVPELRAENERLRAALENIANPVLTDPNNPLSRIARAALTNGEKE